MRPIFILFLSILLGLSACKNAETSSSEKGPASENGEAADITLRATSDVQTVAPIKAASFVPNSVASWLGHIILLDEKGTLHRATTDSVEADIVAIGKYSDVIGLLRDQQSGVFLVLNPQGQVKAFVQIDDEGNFGPMAVSMGDIDVKQFCPATSPIENVLWVRTTSNTSLKLSVETFEDVSVTLSETDFDPNETDPCLSSSLNLSEVYSVKADNSSAGLLLNSGNKTMTVGITDGLSIGQIEDAGFVTLTTANMGSVYNEGLLLVAEKDKNRIVLISRAYALKEIGRLN